MKRCKLLCLIFATCFGALSLGGCMSDLFEEGNNNIDATKVQIYVGTYDGGYGQEYLQVWKKEFEELHKDDEYVTPSGETKVGVEVVPNLSSDYGAQLETMIGSAQDDIIFGEAFDYYALAQSGQIAAIDDLVTETSPFDGKSIESKMTTDQINFYKVDGHYYGLPNYEAVYGLYYDVDLFELNGYYFNKNGQLITNAYQAELAAGNLSYGPDGKTGIDPETGIDYSIDDGLPANLDQFFTLADKMVEDQVWVMTYADSLQFYYNQFLTSLTANFMGRSEMMLNQYYTGTSYTLVESIDPDGTVHLQEGGVPITPATGYLLQKQAGRYYALEFTEKILDSTKLYAYMPFTGSKNHVDAQDAFLKSRYPDQTSTNTKPIAMLLDSSWWYNEASGTMATMAQTVSPQCAANRRRIGYMPLPNETEGGKQNTLFAANTPSVVIKSSVEDWRMPIVKEFLQFALSDEMLSKYSITTNAVYSLKYTLTDEDEENATYFLKSLMAMHENSEIVYPISTSAIYRVGAGFTSGSARTGFFSLVDGVQKTYPSNALGQDGISAIDYFNGLSAYWTAEAWERTYGTAF